MLDTIKKEWQAQASLLIFIVLTIWWLLSPYFQKIPGGRFFGDFPSIYAIMALWGSIWGLIISQKWGGLHSIIGKAIIAFSLGLFFQVFGQVAYAYLSFYQHIEVPYPSLGDVGYFGSIPVYIYGVFLLAKSSGIKIKLRSFHNQMKAILIPLCMLILGYFLFLQNYTLDWSNPIKVFLDFGYPFGQAIYISLAILTYLLSRGILGGIMRSKIIFIFFALLVQYLSDYTFLYQSSRGTWTVGGFNDYMYLIAYLLMTLALFQLKTVSAKLRE